jgi:alpha-beta hydrolase superfamily lysophospholipase
VKRIKPSFKIKSKWLRRSLWTVLLVFILMNIMAMFHAYKFTHFSEGPESKRTNPEKLSTGQKISTLFLGVSNPRPKNYETPLSDYKVIRLKSNKNIECWEIKTKNALGTVVLFHGYCGDKSSMLDKAEIFEKMGYNILLVDFMGSGGSEGNQTTIGYFEAMQVKTCFQYLKKKGENSIYLYGTSMGAVAIMKSIHDSNLEPKGIILECPFGTMYQTVCSRFKSMNAPTFPMAGLLVFWGGIENGFWAFGHNPDTYAKSIKCPVLLLYGAKDKRVCRSEINNVFRNLNGKKKLVIYPDAGHENYLNDYKKQWTIDVQSFFKSVD